MSYTKSTDFLAKDSLPLNNAAKYLKGSELDAEFEAIETADALNVKTTALGTGVETFLGTPSSANLAAAVTGETGTGALVFGTGPTLSAPVLGTPAGGTLTNCTGLPQAGTVGLTTADSPQFAAINVGDAADTTITRASAGVIAVEGSNVLLASGLGSVTQAYDATLAALAGALTAANKIPYATGLNTLGELDFKDEDNMASDSATAVPSQQSVKAYVTTSVAAITSATIGTPVNSTSGTSIDFTSIPAGTKMIVISGSGVSTNGTSDLIVQIGDSGGVETSGYSCPYNGFNGTTRGTATDGWHLHLAVAAASVYELHLILTLIDSSTNTWTGQGYGDPGGFRFECGGSKSLSATLDRVRLTTGTGVNTFDAGKVNILYI